MATGTEKAGEGSKNLGIPSITISSENTQPQNSDDNTDDEDQNATFGGFNQAIGSEEPVVNRYKMKLLEELRQIDEKEKRIEEDTEMPQQSEKQKILRNLRKKRRDIRSEISSMTFETEYQKYRKKVKEQERKESKKRVTYDTFEVSNADLAKLTLADDKKDEYHRCLKTAETYRASITKIFDEINNLLDEDTELMTDTDLERRNVLSRAKLETMKTMVNEYKKQKQELSSLTDINDLPKHIQNLQDALDLTNVLKARMEANEEQNKKRIALRKGEQLEGLKMTKFNGTGEQRFLDYHSFSQEFAELVLSKAYSDSTKLRYLKQYVDGEAKDVIRNYHSGKELHIALKQMDDSYGRSDMVIRESLKNIRKIEPLRSDYNLRANKKFLYQITTNVSTLRCYNFDIDGNETENSTFMISIEEKLPQETFLKWEDEKSEMRKKKESITIDSFVTFFTEKIRKEENAYYVRQGRNDADDKKHPSKIKSKVMQTNVQAKQQYGGTHNNKKAAATNWPRNDGSNHSKHQALHNAKYGKTHCIFCESPSHDTGYCKVNSYTREFKEERCRKHHACYGCFKTTDHRIDTCPTRKQCQICAKYHHFNIHSRSDIKRYYEKKNKGKGSQ